MMWYPPGERVVAPFAGIGMDATGCIEATLPDMPLIEDPLIEPMGLLVSVDSCSSTDLATGEVALINLAGLEP